MVAIHQRLKTDGDVQQPSQRQDKTLTPGESRDQPAAERSEDSDAPDIPIFCAGGCGEVVGYLPKGHKVLIYRGRGYEHWCPACEAADIAKKRMAKAVSSFTSTDELAGLSKPPRDLRKLRLIQVAAVALIIAGSAYIAMGRVVGIYLAAFGTLAWLASCLVIWKLKD